MTAPQLALNHCFQSSMTVSSVSNIPSKPTLSPLLRPQALLMNPDVLVRATVAESLSKQVEMFQLSALSRPPSFSASNRMAIVAALASQQEFQLHHQLLQLRLAMNTSPEICGVNKKVPVIDAPPGRERPTLSPRRQKYLKMMEIGTPLMAPPRLATAIVKRAATLSTTRETDNLESDNNILRPLKKRKLGHPLSPPRVSPVSSNVILTSEELDFVAAAQCLHHSPKNSPKRVSPMMPPHPLLKNALKPPPTINL